MKVTPDIFSSIFNALSDFKSLDPYEVFTYNGNTWVKVGANLAVSTQINNTGGRTVQWFEDTMLVMMEK